MQGQMEVMNYDWGVVSVLYQSTDFRLYVFKRDPTFAAVLAEKINDFERRIQEEDYWPPKVPEDLHKIYKDLHGKEDVKQLDRVLGLVVLERENYDKAWRRYVQST